MRILKTKFDIILLKEIGTRNIAVVKHLYENYEFHYILPSNNLYGGVGLHFSKNIHSFWEYIGTRTVTPDTLFKT